MHTMCEAMLGYAGGRGEGERLGQTYTIKELEQCLVIQGCGGGAMLCIHRKVGECPTIQ